MASDGNTGTGGTRLRKNRNRFVAITSDPETPMSSVRRPPAGISRTPTDRVATVAEWFLGQDSTRERFAWALRDSLDELLDGQRTGRWCYQHLKKTERTYLGTAVEINLTKEFEISDGQELDWRIAGVEIDCKFSKHFGGWEIPMEMYVCADHGDQSGSADHVALLLWMSDDDSEWAAGLVQIKDELLRFKKDGSRQYNRDNKRRLNDAGLEHVHWLWGGLQGDLPPNLLRHLDAETRGRILDHGSGQQRVNALFREVQRQLVTRATVMTVAQQDDSMKRARDARLPKQLGGEGFLVLGHQEADPYIARALGLPVPVKGEFVSCRIEPSTSPANRRVYLGDGWWQLAPSTPHEKPIPAPARDLYRRESRVRIENGPTPPSAG